MYTKNMRHKGIERHKRLKDEMKGFTTMMSIMKGEELPTIKRKKRSIETKKRDMEEKVLEKQIILSLKMMGCGVAKSGEQATYNSHFVLNGMSDLIIFVPGCNVIFMEVKLPYRRNHKNGGLTGKQPDFQELCLICGVKYAIVYNINDALQEVRKIKG